jgi:hypothetical protein
MVKSFEARDDFPAMRFSPYFESGENGENANSPSNLAREHSLLCALLSA